MAVHKFHYIASCTVHMDGSKQQERHPQLEERKKSKNHQKDWPNLKLRSILTISYPPRQ